MMCWNRTIQRPLPLALMGFGAKLQLLCLCLSTKGGGSQFSSSREASHSNYNTTPPQTCKYILKNNSVGSSRRIGAEIFIQVWPQFIMWKESPVPCLHGPQSNGSISRYSKNKNCVQDNMCFNLHSLKQ